MINIIEINSSRFPKLLSAKLRKIIILSLLGLLILYKLIKWNEIYKYISYIEKIKINFIDFFTKFLNDMYLIPNLYNS